MQAAQHLVVEAGAHLACVDEPTAGVVVAKQQGAEPDARALRVGEAADDELLARDAFELQPILGPPGAVRRVGPFGDETFPAQAARLAVVHLPLGVPVLGVAQRVIERQQPAQDPLALQQRPQPGVAVTGIQHVEQVEVGGHRGEQGLAGSGLAEPLL
jgi:hypothetical protein